MSGTARWFSYLKLDTSSRPAGGVSVFGRTALLLIQKKVYTSCVAKLSLQYAITSRIYKNNNNEIVVTGKSCQCDFVFLASFSFVGKIRMSQTT